MAQRRGDRVIAVRFVNGAGQKVWESKADCCRALGITMKKLDRCLELEEPVWIGGQRWYLDMRLEPEVKGKEKEDER